MVQFACRGAAVCPTLTSLAPILARQVVPIVAPLESTTQNRRVYSVTVGDAVPRRSESSAFRASSGRAAAENLDGDAPLLAPVCVYSPESHGWPWSSW